MAISFDESNDYFSIADHASLTMPDGDWSIGVWTKLADNTGALYQYVFSNNNVAVNGSINLFIGEAGAAVVPDDWRFALQDDDGTAINVDSTSSPGGDGVWRLIVCQRDTTANEVQMWFCQPGGSATKYSTADTNLDALNGGAWNIGRRTDADADRYYGGIACEFWVINDACLSQAEIEALGAGRPIHALGYEPDCYLPMTASVAILYDLFGGNNASRNDSPTSVEHAPVGGICGPLTMWRSTKSNTQSAAGTLTSAGMLAGLAQKALAGTLTSAGAVVKQIAVSAAGTLTSAGALVKQAGKPLAGTLTSAGAVVRQAGKPLAGTLTSAGAIVKQTAISAAGTLTSAGALARQISKPLAGALTSAGAVVKRISPQALAGTLTSSGTLAALAQKVLAGTLTTAGALARKAGKLLLAGTLTTAGTLARKTSRPLAGTLTSAGAVLSSLVRSVGPIVRGADDGIDSDVRGADGVTPPKIKSTTQL